MKRIIILTESIDEGILYMWYFHTENKYTMAQYILQHLDKYEEMFKGISWQSGLYEWRRSGNCTPETLLLAIDNSSIDGDSESRFQIHEIDPEKTGEEAEDVTWTNDEELREFAAETKKRL